MPGKPPFFAQEREYSCAPACLPMVMACEGLEKPKDDIRYECECDDEGTSPGKLIAAAKSFGFAGTFQAHLRLDGLRKCIEDGLYPIVYIAMPGTHAAVVTEISETEVRVHDPAVGPDVTIQLDQFVRQFEGARKLTIIVRR
jgi:ABC-type bacteriocin/lantibiotic exporter with double-glycine peptidase domain